MAWLRSSVPRSAIADRVETRSISRGQVLAGQLAPGLALVTILGAGVALRVWQIDAIGYYLEMGNVFGRLVSAAIGVATVYVVYLLASLLYGRKAGIIAALFMALMPYHVVVSRQVLLDGPMVFFATLGLYMVARFGVTGRAAWLYAAGGVMGLAFLSKETSIVLLGSLYAFFALSPSLRVRLRDLLFSLGVMALVIAPFPISLMLAGRTETGQSYLVWQLFRRPNHEWYFYPLTIPDAIGLMVVAAAILGFWLLRRQGTWKEVLLISWIAVPVLFFQMWPVKGFQYLLPIAPPIAVLAGRMLALWSQQASEYSIGSRNVSGQWLSAFAVAAIAFTLFMPSWQMVQPSTDGTFLAGTGGVVGGREAGHWVRENVPQGATMMTIGPSMANILQFYGHRKAYGLSVSPNPLHRNPS